nr:neural Wiskott-Aldrich syndrome protein-like [Aegilops tauschii subsp. strangulata]
MSATASTSLRPISARHVANPAASATPAPPRHQSAVPPPPRLTRRGPRGALRARFAAPPPRVPAHARARPPQPPVPPRSSARPPAPPELSAAPVRRRRLRVLPPAPSPVSTTSPAPRPLVDRALTGALLRPDPPRVDEIHPPLQPNAPPSRVDLAVPIHFVPLLPWGIFFLLSP